MSLSSHAAEEEGAETAAAAATLVFTSITPNTGPETGGTPVTIAGKAFIKGKLASILIGGVPCTSLKIASARSATCVTAANPAAGLTSVKLARRNGTGTTAPNKFTYIGPPRITTVEPNSGDMSTTTALTIRGTNLDKVNKVQLGTINCTSVRAAPKNVTCNAGPASTPGAVDVKLSTSDNQSATLTGGFTYYKRPALTGVTPDVGFSNGGQTITISGRNLESIASVSLGGSRCAIGSATPTAIICTTGARFSPGLVSLSATDSGGQSYALSNVFTYVSPFIGSSPNVGCAHFRDYLVMAELSDADQAGEMLQTWQRLCTQTGSSTGSTIYYSNGKVATYYYNSVGATWYYPSGRVASYYAGNTGATWYYPNARIATSYSGTTGATWYYPSGRIATSYSGQKNATWYHPNGQTITSYAGVIGAYWYYSNGRIISSYMGQQGATWYDEQGSVKFSSGPALSEAQLSYPTRVLLALYYDGLQEDIEDPQYPGCKELGVFLSLAKIAGNTEATGEMTQMNSKLCGPIGGNPGSSVYYSNGQLATSSLGTLGATWYYPNGRVATYYAGKVDTTFYYPDGDVASYSTGKNDATYYYPDNRVATYYWNRVDATWYYPNNQVITSYAGRVGATWYYASGHVISYYMGQSGKTWYNDDGSIWTSNGPALSQAQLLNVPKLLAEIMGL